MVTRNDSDDAQQASGVRRRGAGKGPAASRETKAQLATRVAELLREKAELEQRLTELEEENTNLKAGVDEVARKAAEAVEEVERLRTQLRQEQGRSEQLKKQLAAAIKTRDRYRKIALVDPMTTLLTRMGLAEWLKGTIMSERAKEVNRAVKEEREPNPLTITVMFQDVEKFKTINDGFGHAVGDRVLSLYGRSWRGTLSREPQQGASSSLALPFAKTATAAARWGGDEQVIVAIGLFDPRQHFGHMAVDFKAAHQRDRKAIQSVASIPGFADHPHSVRVALMTATLEEGQGVQHVFQLIDALGRAVKAEDVRAADRTETTSFENAINARELPYRPEVGEIYVVDKLELVPDTRGLMR